MLFCTYGKEMENNIISGHKVTIKALSNVITNEKSIETYTKLAIRKLMGHLVKQKRHKLNKPNVVYLVWFLLKMLKQKNLTFLTFLKIL